METLLQRYNVHKRFTLDRITARYSHRANVLLTDFYKTISGEVFEALESGKSSFSPDLSDVPDLSDLLDSHFKKIVNVGVSDGYLEITPEKKLGLWLDHNIYKPVEDCFSTKLARKRDTLADLIEKEIGSKRRSALIGNQPLIELLDKEQTLKYLKSAYRNLSSDWVEGKSSIAEVKKVMVEALNKNARQVETIFRTETTRWFNESRHEYFKTETSVSHVQLFAVTDGRISDICECRNGYVIPIEKAGFKKYMPPFHPNCRTVQRGLLEGMSRHDHIIRRGLDMNESKFVPLPKGWAA